MTYKSFKAEAAERARTLEPITFDLPGIDGMLTAVPSLPFGVLEDLVNAPDPPDVSDVDMAKLPAEEQARLMKISADSFAALRTFFETVVPPEQHDTLAQGIRASDVATLKSAMQWLIGELTALPTEPPSASASGQPAGGNGTTSTPDAKDLAPSLP